MTKEDVSFKNDAKDILESVPDLYLILNTDFKIVDVSEAYLNATMTERHKIVGAGIFEVFPDNPNDPNATGVKNLRDSLNRVLINKKQDIMAIQKYDIRSQASGGEFETRYWSSMNSPVFDKNNHVKYIIHRAIDVTSFIQEKELTEKMKSEIHHHVQRIDEVNNSLRVAEATRLAIIKAIPDAMLTINRDGVMTDVNTSLITLFGYTQEELLGKKMEMLLAEPYRNKYSAQRDHYFASTTTSPMGLNMELFAQQKAGTVFPVEMSLSPLTTTQGQCAIAIIRDVRVRTHQTQLLLEKEQELLETNRKLKVEKKNLDDANKKMLLLTELSETLLACKNQKEMLIAFSSYVKKILDFCCGALYLFDASHAYLEETSIWGELGNHEQNFAPDDCWGIRRGMAHETSVFEPGVPCDHIVNPQNESIYICTPVAAQNEVFGLMYVDIGHEQCAQLSESRLLINMVVKTIALAIANINLRNLLLDQSIIDFLTGLYNRRFLDEYLIKQIFYAKRRNVQLALIMFDIDDFKKINDTYGHDAGDTILKKIGELMTRITRAEDMVCRYGGEEFVFVIQNCSLAIAKKRTEEIRKEAAKINEGSHLPMFTVSLGISIYPNDGETPHELVAAADKALYEAKKSGKNKALAYCDLKKDD